ncbi:hypothetical protein NDU88_003484 [Pleurodeles waltl]|uniref:Secreted protein n=1 Tax=Pleurodeles waltl TaxID=8319 RepID=A0AAV7WSH1_PLEWA|nr:hypothetical protein NDU88_003484 [Pleurodeles waltl]
MCGAARRAGVLRLGFLGFMEVLTSTCGAASGRAQARFPFGGRPAAPSGLSSCVRPTRVLGGRGLCLLGHGRAAGSGRRWAWDAAVPLPRETPPLPDPMLSTGGRRRGRSRRLLTLSLWVRDAGKNVKK